LLKCVESCLQKVTLLFRKFGRLLPFRLRLLIGYGGTRAQLIARSLHNFLPSWKFDKWIAWRNSGTIVASEDFRREIDKRIAAVDYLLMVWTSESPNSDEANRELMKAVEFGTEIFPFIERGAPPPAQFAGKQDIAFEHDHASDYFRQVLANLEALRRIREDMFKVKVKLE
jgi:hypothetical protein